MNLTKTESQLLALALNPAAHNGEVANSAAAFIRSLRKRNVTPQQFTTSPSDDTLLSKISTLTTINRDLKRTAESQAA